MSEVKVSSGILLVLFFFFFFFFLSVKAVYDVTLNFKDKENPTLLGIINGKKYRADMSVRLVFPLSLSALLAMQ